MTEVNNTLCRICNCLILVGITAALFGSAAGGYPAIAVDHTAVKLTEGFWHDRLATSRNVTLPHCLRECERTSKIRYFDIAAGRAKGAWVSKLPYDDSDVYKVLEGAAYQLALDPDPALDAYVDTVIEKVAAAQLPDGYLYTWRSVDPNENSNNTWWYSDQRWGNLVSGGELRWILTGGSGTSA